MQSEVKTDYLRLVKILKKQGYEGYFPVETLLAKGKPYDPFALVSEMIKELRIAIDQVYN